MFALVLWAADSGQDLFQKGLVKERTEADFRGAIKLYERVVKEHAADRKLAAQALFRIAECEQALGSRAARTVYERVVREFADQPEAAADARKRLSALGGVPEGIMTRQLWTGQGVFFETVPFETAPAADGRSVLFVDWKSGDLATRDLVTGEVRHLGLADDGLRSFVQFGLYSPDKREIALTFSSPEDGYHFAVVSTQAGAKRRVLVKNPELTYFKPFAWSADSKQILTLIWRKDNTTAIAWVSAADGSIKTLKSMEWRAPTTISLSPDGRYIAYDATERQNSIDRDIFILAADGSSETPAVKNAGIDNNPVWAPDGSHLIFTSNRSGNFGLYAQAVQDGKARGAPPLLKASVGQITLSGFVRTGSLYYLQPTGEQNVYRAELDPSSGKLRNTPVPVASTYTTNNGHSALSPDGRSVAYLATDTTAALPAVVVKSLEDGIARLFSTDLAVDWAPMWFPSGRELLLAARRLPLGTGQAFYRLDLDSGRITRLLENGVNWVQPGSATGQRELSGDGKTVYVSVSQWNESEGGGLAAVNLFNGQVKRLYEAEGLGAVSVSPDSRTLALMTGGRVVVMGADGSNPRTLFEARDLSPRSGVAWSSDNQHVLFVRGQTELWRVPASGGEPAATGIRGTQLREIRGGPKGALTYTDGSPRKAELWALDNLLPVLRAAK